MMAMPFGHMHGPEHHVMVGMALLTAWKNAGGEIDLKKGLTEMYSRGRTVPGGRLRILGRLRRRDQYGDFYVNCHRRHSSWRRKLRIGS